MKLSLVVSQNSNPYSLLTFSKIASFNIASASAFKSKNLSPEYVFVLSPNIILLFSSWVKEDLICIFLLLKSISSFLFIAYTSPGRRPSISINSQAYLYLFLTFFIAIVKSCCCESVNARTFSFFILDFGFLNSSLSSSGFKYNTFFLTAFINVAFSNP